MSLSMSVVRSRRHAFTLIELLVVVAIIALLISILLPSLSQARAMARSVKCASIEKQFGMAHHMYANEADDWFVPHTLNNTSLPWYRNIKFRANLSLGAGSNYPEGLVCPDVPADRIASAGHNYGGNGVTDTNGVIAPKSETLMFNQGDYDTGSFTTGSQPGRRHFRSKVKNPTAKLQLTDGSDWNLNKSRADHILWWDLYPELNGGTGTFGGGSWNQPSYRHNSGQNILMFDGHVEYMGMREIMNASDTAIDGGKRDRLWDPYR